MRRLYLHLYLTVAAILLLFGVLAAVGWGLGHPTLHEGPFLQDVGAVAGELLPGPQRPTHELQEKLERLSHALHPEAVAVYTPDGSLLAWVGAPVPLGTHRHSFGWFHPAHGMAASVRLPDGRWLVVRHQGLIEHRAWLVFPLLLAFAVALGAYPLVRPLTRRLERLKSRVEALGQGDLSTRVQVEGKDEIADLARAFNQAAARIERLVAAQKGLLAGASHELRSPLARLRVALELMKPGERPDLRAGAEREIAELDALIDELLLASRLDALVGLDRTEEVDLLALLAEEAARAGAEVEGTPLSIQGDPRLLRRLVRNLLDNARRHGAGSRVEAFVERRDGRARLRVCDRGPGVPAAERERIFDPFYRLPGAAAPEGAGLGLALVRQIARRHGGDAACQPRDGGGSCFEVELPLSPI